MRDIPGRFDQGLEADSGQSSQIRILLERDSPVSYQGKESRPRDVRTTLENVAKIKEVGPVIVSGQTTLNASQLFQIPFVSETS